MPGGPKNTSTADISTTMRDFFVPGISPFRDPAAILRILNKLCHFCQKLYRCLNIPCQIFNCQLNLEISIAHVISNSEL